MTSTPKTGISIDTSGLLDGTPADASDASTPLNELLALTKSGGISASNTDASVKHLSDALLIGAGLGNTLLNPGADESLQLRGLTAIVPFNVLGSSVGSILISSIPPIFDHLRLVLGVTTLAAALVDDLLIHINGDIATANYASLSANIQHNAALSTTQSLESTTAGGQLKNAAAGGTAAAGYLGVLYVDIYEYAQTGRPRNVRWSGLVRLGTATGQTRLVSGCFMWKNTAAAINTLRVVTGSGLNINGGSGYGLYGIR